MNPLIAQPTQGHGLMLRVGGYDFYGYQSDGKLFFDDVHRVVYNPSTAMNDTTTTTKLMQDLFVNVGYLLPVFNDHFDILFSLSTGNTDMPTSATDSDFVYRKQYGVTTSMNLLTSLDARFNYNIWDRSHTVSPYLTSGFTLTSFKRDFGFALPVGLGFNFNLAKRKKNDLYLNLESLFKFGLSDGIETHYQHHLGFLYFPDFKEKAPPAPMDTDGDGITDDIDKCPDVAGLSALGGCPDTDNDGIADADDKCPTVAGLAKFDGCPIPDTDGDGINDEEDQCPSVAGSRQYNGCPIPDTDGDGFNDQIDKCPKVASPTNDGCPVVTEEVQEKIKKAAGQVHFESSKSVLTEDSDENLDIIAGLLIDNPLLMCDINGYTDSSGNYQSNVKLSNDRAKVCYDYLISKGVDASRLTYKGHGPKDPVATNKTKEGRAKNRRTEFTVRNY